MVALHQALDLLMEIKNFHVRGRAWCKAYDR